MNWEPSADAEAKGIVRAHAEDLYDEAERVAARANAPGVSVEYVRIAAATVGLRRTSTVADAFLAVGPSLATLAAGVGVTELTTKASLNLSPWLVGGSITAAAVGLLLTGAGIALKVRG